MTRSLHVALADLRLDRAWIVYPGRERYAVHEKVDVLPLGEVPNRLGSALGRKKGIEGRIVGSAAPAVPPARRSGGAARRA